VSTTSTDLTRLTAAETASAVAAGEASAVDVTQAHLDRIAAVDGAVAAFLHVDTDGALAAARAVDERRSAGEALGPLAGVPLALKDVFTTRGIPTTCGSKILEGWLPPYDATVTRRLREAGVVILGKTNMDEFAMGSVRPSTPPTATAQPWDLTASGGSGAVGRRVAGVQAPLAIGTDTAARSASRRRHRHGRGEADLRRRSSRYGLSRSTHASTRRPVRPHGAGRRAAARGDRGTTARLTRIDRRCLRGRGGARRRRGCGSAWARARGEGYQPGVRARSGGGCAAEELGAEVVEVSCPSFTYALPAYYLINPSECSSNLARFDAMRYGLRVGDDGTRSAEEVMALTRAAGFGAEVKRRIILGTYALSSGYYDAYYGSAQKVRTLIARDFDAAYAQVDVLVSPTTPTTAFLIGERTDDPLAMYLADLCTIPSNLAGSAAMSVPCGLAPEDGLPVGLQIMAPATG
jgi:aspartyl-tRNA(Asn)/glutamyl-tRNA(Gln) amidotransferase subunit A